MLLCFGGALVCVASDPAIKSIFVSDVSFSSNKPQENDVCWTDYIVAPRITSLSVAIIFTIPLKTETGNEKKMKKMKWSRLINCETEIASLCVFTKWILVFFFLVSVDVWLMMTGYSLEYLFTYFSKCKQSWNAVQSLVSGEPIGRMMMASKNVFSQLYRWWWYGTSARIAHIFENLFISIFWYFARCGKQIEN